MNYTPLGYQFGQQLTDLYFSAKHRRDYRAACLFRIALGNFDRKFWWALPDWRDEETKWQESNLRE